MTEKQFWVGFAAAMTVVIAVLALSGPDWLVYSSLVLAFVFGLPAINERIRRKLYDGGDGPPVFRRSRTLD